MQEAEKERTMRRKEIVVVTRNGSRLISVRPEGPGVESLRSSLLTDVKLQETSSQQAKREGKEVGG